MELPRNGARYNIILIENHVTVLVIIGEQDTVFCCAFLIQTPMYSHLITFQ